jgi:hypothetical protein
MARLSWHDVFKALSTTDPTVKQHDSDGTDLYFPKHRSTPQGAGLESIPAGGYRDIKTANTVNGIFERVRPQGITPTGIRVRNILRTYLSKLDGEMTQGKEPLNIVVITDGIFPDEPDLCSLGHKTLDEQSCGEDPVNDKSGMCGIFRRHRRGCRNRQKANGKENFEEQV